MWVWDYGFEKGQGFIRILKKDAVTMVLKKYPEITESQVRQIIQFLTLLERLSIGKPPEGYGSQTFFHGVFNWPISYLRRPLVNYKDEKGDDYLYYGYHGIWCHTLIIFYLIYNGKLPERKSQKMRDYMVPYLVRRVYPFQKRGEKTGFRRIQNLRLSNTKFDLQVKRQRKKTGNLRISICWSLIPLTKSLSDWVLSINPVRETSWRWKRKWTTFFGRMENQRRKNF